MMTTVFLCVATMTPAAGDDLSNYPDPVYLTADQRKTMMEFCEKAIAKEDKKDDKKAKAENALRKKNFEALAARIVRLSDTLLYKEGLLLLDVYTWAAKDNALKAKLLTKEQHEAMVKNTLWYSEYFSLPKFKKGDPKGQLSKEIQKVVNPLALKIGTEKELTIQEELDLLGAYLRVCSGARGFTPKEIYDMEMGN